MKTIVNPEKVELKISKSALLENRYLPLTTLSSMLFELENQQKLGYKMYRNRLYNSSHANKYNTKEIAGIKCIDVYNPMQSIASLILSFEVTE